MRASDFIVEQPTTTTTPQGVTTTVNKAANRVTTRSDAGTVVKDRSGRVRSVQTPKIGGLQAKQTFRPDSTPGYQKIDYKTGSGVNVSAKGSQQTGYTTTVGTNVGGMNVKQTDATARGGKKTTDLSYTTGGGQKLKAKLTQSQFEDVQSAIREHIKQGIPFTECMFRAGSPAFTEFYRQVREVADKLNLDWQDQELLTTDIGECIVVEGELVPLDVPMEATSDFDGELEDLYAELEDAKMDRVHDTYRNIMMGGRQGPPDEDEVGDYIPKGMTKEEIAELIKMLDRQGYDADFLTKDLAPLAEAEYNGKKVKLNSPKRGGPKKFYVYVKNPKTGRVKKISWGDTTGLSVKAKDRGAVRSFVARHKCKQANDKMTARYWSCRTPRYKALGVKGGQWW